MWMDTVIAYGKGTDVGTEREHNEDNYAAMPELGLWLVADGMGGHASGEVASAIVAEHITDQVREGIILTEAVATAHNAILNAPEQGRGQSGMGSTVVVLKITGNNYQISWVGDSRAYLWNGFHLKRLTRDHSFVQQLLDGGAISGKEAQEHMHRNIITQALGSTDIPRVQVDTIEGELYRDELIMLCSDGLTAEVSDEMIEKVFKEESGEQEIVDSLIELALERDGSDNVTVLVIPAPESARQRSRLSKTVSFDADALNRRLNNSNWRYMAIGAIVSLVMMAAGFGLAHQFGWIDTLEKPVTGRGVGAANGALYVPPSGAEQSATLRNPTLLHSTPSQSSEAAISQQKESVNFTGQTTLQDGESQRPISTDKDVVAPMDRVETDTETQQLGTASGNIKTNDSSVPSNSDGEQSKQSSEDATSTVQLLNTEHQNTIQTK